jgi:SAM-dependent methyltransferase
MRSLELKPGDRVLEVGSGGSPYERSDVLLDRFIEDTTHREGAPIRISERFIVGDAQYLPFGDGAFDYLICSHTLEHLDDPAAALREMGRVSARGYIETPNLLSEILFGWDFHKWVFSEQDGKLTAARKGWKTNAIFGDYFHALARDNADFRRFYYTHYHLFNVMYHWEHAVNFIMRQEAVSIDEGPFDFTAIALQARELGITPDPDPLARVKGVSELVTPPIIMRLIKRLYRMIA